MKNIILLITVAMFGCNKNTELVEEQLGFVIDADFEFCYRNREGKDLLDPNTIGSFNHNLLQVYAIENGSKKVIPSNRGPGFIIKERGYYTLFCSTYNVIPLT